MKHFILLNLLLVFFSVSLSAQRDVEQKKITAEAQAEKVVEHMNNKYQLSQEQQQELKIWYTQQIEARKADFEKIKAENKSMRDVMQKQQEETTKKLKEVLTEEQYKQYEEEMQKRQQGVQNTQKHGHGHDHNCDHDHGKKQNKPTEKSHRKNNNKGGKR